MKAVVAIKAAAAACLLALASEASAQLYSTAPFDPELAFASDSVPGQFNNQRLAETFVISDPAAVGSVRWWGRSEGAFFPDLRNMETFTIRIYNDAAALPGGEIFSDTVPVAAVLSELVGVDSQGRHLYRFDFNVGVIDLLPGDYWLSVGTDNFDPDGDGFYWMASQQVISDNFAADGGVNGTWSTSGFADLALEIYAVPAPATLLALSAGLAALTTRRQRTPKSWTWSSRAS